MNPQDLIKSVKELAGQMNQAAGSDEMLAFQKFAASFYNYSPFNQFLIFITKPDAQMVAGFQAWLKRGRYVRKGEHGIAILAPCFRKVTDQETGKEYQNLSGFRTAYVFDVSQTEGEPLPEPPNWKSPEMFPILHASLIHFAESCGIKVDVKKLAGECQGYSKGGEIALDPTAGTKTLVHELAHELLHHGKNPQPHHIEELQAEATAWLVISHFGFDCPGSANYILLNGATQEELFKHMQVVQQTAAKIINAVTPAAEPQEA
jgi:hypothetical protein